MSVPEYITRAVQERVERNREEREAVLRAIQAGDRFRAEHDVTLKARRLQRFADVDLDTALTVVRTGDWGPLALEAPRAETVQAALAGFITFLSVAYLERGHRAATAVARILFPSGKAHGTAFMISRELLITNHHVIPDAEAAGVRFAQFNFARDANGTLGPATRFSLAPDRLFMTNCEDDLDYTIVALGGPLASDPVPPPIGVCPLLDRDDTSLLGDNANVIHHPEGRAREILIRDNLLVGRPGRVLHYLSRTEPRSSGAPVFNDDWEVIALHHEKTASEHVVCSEGPRTTLRISEGIRVAAIIQDVVDRQGECSDDERNLLRDALGPRIVV